MKLIRIASADQLTGLFSNEFSEAITLPPQSKIALLNGVFAMNSKSIYVPSDATITFKPKNGVDEVTATLLSGYYTQTSLLTAVTQIMNYALPQSVMGTTCFAWSAALTKHHVSLNFARSAQTIFPPDNLKKLTFANNVFTSTATTAGGGQFESFGYSNVTVLPYNTELGLTPYDGTGAASDAVHFIYGLLYSKPTSATTFLRQQDFKFGIFYNGSDASYIINGNIVATEEYFPSIGSTITFDRNTVNFDEEFDTTITDAFSTDGYHLGFGLRANAVSIRDTLFNQNPFVSSSITNGVVSKLKFPLEQILHSDNSLGTTASATKVTVTMSDTMKTVLGFDDNPTPMTATQGNYVGSLPISTSSTPTSITVELPNLGGQIESYDGISQKRRPIVAVVPSLNASSGMLTYEPPHPPFIDLGNRYPIQLSKLEVRLLSSFDDSEVNLENPGCTLSFLLDHNEPQKTTD